MTVDEAIPAYDRLVELAPDVADFWFDKAEQERILGRTPDALRAFTRFFVTRPPGAHDQPRGVTPA